MGVRYALRRSVELMSVSEVPYLFEPASLGDAARLAQMSGRLIERGLTPRWTARRIADALRDSETASVVARHGGAIIGFAVMAHDFPRHEAHLLLLAVEPEARRCGLGQALVKWLEKTARLGGTLRFQLEVRADDPGACSFYRSLGYREVDRLPGYYEGRLDAVRMTRAPLGD